MNANSIVVKVKDQLHLFLFDEQGTLMDIPSIPISDEQKIYENITDSNIMFTTVTFEPIDPSDNSKLETYEDFERFKYHISDVFSYTVSDKDGNPITVGSLMEEGKLQSAVYDLYKGDVE